MTATLPPALVPMDLQGPRPAFTFTPNPLLPPVGGGVVTQIMNHANPVQRIRVTFTSLLLSITTANAYGSILLGYLPNANLKLLGSYCNLTWTKDGTGIATGDNPKLAFGTAIASNATLSSTMSNVLNAGSTGGTSIGTGLTGSFNKSSVQNATPADVWITAGTTNGVYLNGSVAPTGDGSVVINGTFDMYFIGLGLQAS